MNVKESYKSIYYPKFLVLNRWYNVFHIILLPIYLIIAVLRIVAMITILAIYNILPVSVKKAFHHKLVTRILFFICFSIWVVKKGNLQGDRKILYVLNHCSVADMLVSKTWKAPLNHKDLLTSLDPKLFSWLQKYTFFVNSDAKQIYSKDPQQVFEMVQKMHKFDYSFKIFPEAFIKIAHLNSLFKFYSPIFQYYQVVQPIAVKFKPFHPFLNKSASNFNITILKCFLFMMSQPVTFVNINFLPLVYNFENLSADDWSEKIRNILAENLGGLKWNFYMSEDLINRYENGLLEDEKTENKKVGP